MLKTATPLNERVYARARIARRKPQPLRAIAQHKMQLRFDFVSRAKK
jgi:hypothetical protein